MFDDEGNLAGVEGLETPIPRIPKISTENRKLITSASLDFLKDEKPKLDDIFSKDYWSLYEDDTALKPIKFSNGKTQEDVVK